MCRNDLNCRNAKRCRRSTNSECRAGALWLPSNNQGRAAAGLEAPADLRVAARPAHFAVEPFELAGQFGERPDEARIDVLLGVLLPCGADEIFGDRQ